MESITKNRVEKNTLVSMVRKAFPELEINKITELNEGYFNISYLIGLSDNSEVILKIAPPNDIAVMTHEINIMYSEVTSIRMVKRETDIPVPEILFYDNSRTLCGSEYFFMSKLDGNSFNSLKKCLTEEETREIKFEIGRLNRKINHITNDKFGYFGQLDRQGDDWYQVFSDMIGDAIHDAEALKIDLQTPIKKIYELLARDKGYFQEITKPRLVHWDLWAGNVFIRDNKVTGLIDFERCLWADELMEVGFRTCWYNEAFQQGYGTKELSHSQMVRARWYDIYLFLISILECDYRKYETRDTYNWATQMLKKWISEMEKDI